ncbi:MAG: hypothetical protein D9V47_09135 [Clostridia bacterium]|nr:MAG: hypothetical protein D9V47_09135 [Clostridia bacterium]
MEARPRPAEAAAEARRAAAGPAGRRKAAPAAYTRGRRCGVPRRQVPFTRPAGGRPGRGEARAGKPLRPTASL